MPPLIIDLVSSDSESEVKSTAHTLLKPDVDLKVQSPSTTDFKNVDVQTKLRDGQLAGGPLRAKILHYNNEASGNYLAQWTNGAYSSANPTQLLSSGEETEEQVWHPLPEAYQKKSSSSRTKLNALLQVAPRRTVRPQSQWSDLVSKRQTHSQIPLFELPVLERRANQTFSASRSERTALTSSQSFQVVKDSFPDAPRPRKRSRVTESDSYSTSQSRFAGLAGSKSTSSVSSGAGVLVKRPRGRPRKDEQTSNRLRKDGSTASDVLWQGPRPRRQLSPGNLTQTPSVEIESLIHYSRPCTAYKKGSLLRHRELGSHPRLSQRSLHKALRQNLLNHDFRQWKSWTGASKDIITAAWDPRGTTFAAGASTDLDPLNLRYNRSNNLLWGSVELGCLVELDEHHVQRPRPPLENEGSELHTIYNTLDPRLFTTISSICFSATGEYMFTSSYDKTVKLWDTTDTHKPPRCVTTLAHESRVELMSLSTRIDTNFLATAQNDSHKSISLFKVQADHSIDDLGNFTSEEAYKNGYVPTSLQWGTTPSWTDHLVLAGFGENKNDEAERDRRGDIYLWDIARKVPFKKLSPRAQCVFDVAWHPSRAIFAAATTPGSTLTNRKKTRSVIRAWGPFELASPQIEYECPALDINEICFNPQDEHYLSAACTDGTVYVWDSRRPSDIFASLQHGVAIEEMDPERTREDQDTGVRFMSWSSDGSMLYTGSSDGLIRQWNPFVSAGDALVRDVASFDSGVVTAAFSPDYTQLLIGLCKGSIQVLSTAPVSEPNEEGSLFTFTAAAPPKSAATT